jgi:signal transduction histidine kinase
MHVTPLKIESPLESTAQNVASGAVRHLAHELRQPLSGIESIAYYLEMVLPELDEEARLQFGRLRRMVQQANWILEDAVQCVKAAAPKKRNIVLNDTVSEFAARTALEDDLNIALTLDASAGTIFADETHLAALLTRTLAFYREVAECCEPIELATSALLGHAKVTVAAEVDSDTGALRRLLDPTPRSSESLPAGSLRKLVEANGGTLRVIAEEDGRLVLQMQFPTL